MGEMHTILLYPRLAISYDNVHESSFIICSYNVCVYGWISIVDNVGGQRGCSLPRTAGCC